jgi:ribosomal protein L40E
MWAASSRELLVNRAETGVQACVSCGLPLSATARFCRRCGSQQG